MSSRNRFWVGSVALVILVSGLIAPDFFVSTVYAEKPSSGGTTPARTLVEIVSPNVTTAYQLVYTVPAGQRLILTDVITGGGCLSRHIYRGSTEVSQYYESPTSGHSYVSGIEFGEGQTVGVGVGGGCVSETFFELRGYLEAL